MISRNKIVLERISGSSGRVKGDEKHEIYVAAFGGHLFYELFSQGRGTMAPAPPPDPLLTNSRNISW